jgi:hypothetical protein
MKEMGKKYNEVLELLNSKGQNGWDIWTTQKWTKNFWKIQLKARGVRPTHAGMQERKMHKCEQKHTQTYEPRLNSLE